LRHIENVSIKLNITVYPIHTRYSK